DAGEAAEGIGHVGVGQAANHLRGEDLDDVIGGKFAVDGLGFAGGAFGGDQNFEALRFDLEFCLDAPGLACSDVYCLLEGVESEIGNRDGVASGLEVVDEKLAQSVRNSGHALGLNRNLGSNQ